MADVGLRKVINGPEAFTPDNEFCLGETEVDGFFVAAGFCAHGIAGAGGIGKVMAEWIVDGRARAWTSGTWTSAGSAGSTARRRTRWRGRSRTTRPTTTSATPATSAQAGRPLRTSPGLRLARRARRVVRREVRLGAGQLLREQRARPATSRGGRVAGPARLWSPAIGAEHRATREAAALFDESSFAKIEVTGPDAADAAGVGLRQPTWPAASATSPTPRRSTARGGIESDFTVTRRRRRRVPRRHRHRVRLARPGLAAASRPGGATPRVRVDGRHRASASCYALWGPRSRDILRALTGADLRNAAFPFMTAQEITRRRRAGARAAGDVRRRARLGALRAGRVRLGAVDRRCGRRARRTGWSPAATAPSRACGWRRATGSGAPTSRPRPRRTRPGWASA